MYHISNIFSHVQYRGENGSRDNANGTPRVLSSSKPAGKSPRNSLHTSNATRAR